jgi:uncharacterized protein (DUF983 family)
MNLRQAIVPLGRGLGLRCPRCGVGPLFEARFRMYARCTRCGYVFEREPGYFIGAMYINYGITAVLVLGGHFILDALVPLSLATHVLLFGAAAIALPLAFFRHARGLWLAFDFIFDPGDDRPPLKSVR